MKRACLCAVSFFLICLVLFSLTASVPTRIYAAKDERTASASVLPSGSLRDGFYVVHGCIYAVREGQQICTAGSFTLNGMEAECTDAGGVCKVKGEILTDADGNRYCLKDGRVWTKPGLVEIGDDLYCIRRDGRLLCGGSWRTMQFDETGKYTSGSKEIDEYVDAILKEILEPGMTREEKLWACYCYVYRSMEYRGNNNHVPFGKDCSKWSEMYMLRLIEQGKGNCYCFASEMYYLVRRIGYPQARAVSGQIGDTKRADHGWLELTLDGVPHVLDPELDAKRCENMGDIFLKTYMDTPWAYWRP